MVTDKQVARFAKLFQGYDKAYGQARIKTVAAAGEKTTDWKPWTVSEPLTATQWRDHLDGTGPGLGVILLQENNTCRFGALDVDDYAADHVALYNKIAKLNLPLVVCRSKSGGAHLWVFMSEDVAADVLRDRLDEWRAALGLPAEGPKGTKRTEVFPKQVGRAAEETGNWINISYQNADNTMRGCYKGSEVLDLELFLEWAESNRVDAAYMDKPYFKPHNAQNDVFWEGPPCLVALHGSGFPDGTSNDGMFAVGVYLIKRFGDGWVDRMDEYNLEMGRRQSSVEIAGIIKNLSKKIGRGDGKDYTYPCKRSPLNSVCQRRTCLAREYGIGDAGTASVKVEILSVIRYDHPAPDPPLWSFEINGRRVMVDNDTFYSRDALNRACMAQAGCVPLHMPPARWLRQLNELVQSADVVPMPEDASPTGQLWERVEMFLLQGVPALAPEEVLNGKVFREEGNAYFRSVDLFTYLEARRIKFRSEQAVWQLLRAHGADKKVWSFGKKPNVVAANVWFMPYTAKIDESTDPGPSFGAMTEF